MTSFLGTIRRESTEMPALFVDEKYQLISAIISGEPLATTTEVIGRWPELVVQFYDAIDDSHNWPTLDSGQLGRPINPSTVLCAGSNYRAHNAEKKGSPTSGKEPEFFIKTGDCVIGPNDEIIHDPLLTKKLDCETELAIVIGKPGRHIAVENALDHVFGYTVANDVTARDRQVRTNDQGFTWYELGRGKAFDTSLPLGPWISTPETVPDPQGLILSTKINGELRQRSSTADMIWTCAELIHFFSINFTLKPGMVILTGTPAGTAWSNDPSLGGKWSSNDPDLVPASRYCEPGDVIESSISAIGNIQNPIVSY
jgi:2-keto-4-pentenoate hydratase/2-oxohepta-3-ene-1,7-dioic acid hydratase in catechol pathway